MWFRWICARIMPILLLEVFWKTFINRFLNYIWVHLDRRFEISMENCIFWYVQIIYSWFFLKILPKIKCLWKYVEPPNSIFIKLDFETYNLNNRWYSENRFKKSVCPIDFLNLWSTAKCPHQQKERFFSAAANPWDFWSPADLGSSHSIRKSWF